MVLHTILILNHSFDVKETSSMQPVISLPNCMLRRSISESVWNNLLLLHIFSCSATAHNLGPFFCLRSICVCPYKACLWMSCYSLNVSNQGFVNVFIVWTTFELYLRLPILCIPLLTAYTAFLLCQYFSCCSEGK